MAIYLVSEHDKLFINYVKLIGLISFIKSPPRDCRIHLLYFSTYYSRAHKSRAQGGHEN